MLVVYLKTMFLFDSVIYDNHFQPVVEVKVRVHRMPRLLSAFT